jgi:hypothetical protein
MTGYTMNEELDLLVKESTVAYVHKPFTFDQLTTAIDRLMAPPPAAESAEPDPGASS